MIQLLPGTVSKSHNVWTCERAVLESIPEWVPGTDPIRLIVPSESLRRYWVRRICQERPAQLGVEVMTHNQAVRTILLNAGVVVRAGNMWPEYLSRELASDEPILARALGELEDGFALVSGAVAELYDAGIDLEHFEGLIESVRGWPQQSSISVSAGVAPRVIALLTVARSVGQRLMGTPFSWPAQAIAMAIDLLRADPHTVFPCSSVFVLGYSDATCAVSDLLEALRIEVSAVLLVDAPMSPVLAGVVEPGATYAEPFLRRFEGKWAKPLGEKGLPSPTLSCALDPFAEAGLVANSIRRRLKEGCAPEDIGVVVRHLSPWTVPMRTTFEDYAIPFSGVGAKEAGGSDERQALAVSDVLRQGARADIARWLSACGLESQHGVAIAMDAVGVRWADEIAERMPANGEALPLPAREGFGLIDGIPFNQRTVLSAAIVKNVRERSVAWCDAWDEWPEESTGTKHLEHLGRIFKTILQLGSTSSIWMALPAVRKAVPHDESISRTGFIHMVAALLDQQGFIPMGGQGGGVAVLDATEARGRTFQHLYVMGLNRGQFPRVVREDPLLPEGARRALGQLVPDIREKRLGLDEERFLFAQLLQAGRQVHLSMSQRDVAGKALHPSSLVVNLQLHGVVDEVKPATVESLPQWKAGVWAALNSNSAGEAELGIPHSLYSISTARAGWNGQNEPYMGSIGRAVHPMDSRNRPVYVTAVEAVARCPWQAFLVRDLGLETRPDPWGALPAVNTHLLGRVVHAVIERVVSANRGEQEDGVLVPLQWPSASTLESWTLEAAVECLSRDGFAWRGFARAVVEPVRTSIDLLREIDEDLEGVLGGEVTGFCKVPDGPTIHYRADRVGQKEGRTVVTDFKLGRPPTTHKTPKTRREKVVDAVRRGKLLQGMLYACSDGDSIGRYLYLNAGFEYPQREFVFEKTDVEVRDALIHIVDEVSAARAVGAMFPRVSEAGADKIPSACEYCGVREACSVLDSGSRRRIMEAASEPGEVGLTQARARLWWRGSDETE